MKKDELIILLAEGCACVEEKLYFIAREMNLVFTLDMNTGEIDLVDSIPGEDILSRRLSATIAHWNDKLIFTPMTAEKIWIYDLREKTWSSIVRKRQESKEINGNEIFQSVLYEDRLFMIGCNYPAILCVDLMTEQLTYIEEPYERLKEKKQVLGDCFFRCSCVQKEHYLYLASCLDNGVLKFDMSTCQYEWLQVGKSENRYSGITLHDDQFWLSPRCNSAIVKWDGGEGVTEYPLPIDIDEKTYSFIGVVSEKDKVIFPGMFQKSTIVINDTINADMEVYEGQYLFYEKKNDNLAVSMTSEGNIEISAPGNTVKKYVCGVEKEKIREYLQDRKSNIGVSALRPLLNERTIFDMTDFFDLAVRAKETIHRAQRKNCGQEIWKEIKREV